MATKTPSDKTRIEIAARELAALGLDVPSLLERMLADERKLLKMGKTRVKALFAALRLPRGNVDDFLNFPLMSPSLWRFLEGVRLDILMPLFLKGARLGVAPEPLLRHPKRFMKLFVEQIGLLHSRRGRPAPRLHEVAEKRSRAALERLLLSALWTRPAMGVASGPRELPEHWESKGLPFLSAAEVRAHRKQVDEHRRGRQGMNEAQAAVYVAKAWADALIAEEDAEREKRRH